MDKTKYIVSEEDILGAVKYALKLNILDERLVKILMNDVAYEIETLLYENCNVYKVESEDKK